MLPSTSRHRRANSALSWTPNSGPYSPMTILSIAIPHTARRLAPSAPHTALHTPSVGLASANVSTLATPALPGMANGMPTLQQMHELSAALAGFTSLEDLLTALRAKNPKDKQIALEHFRDVLSRESASKLSTSSAVAGPGGAGLLSDAVTSKLVSFASLDDLDSKWAVTSAIDEILKVYLPDQKTAARLALAIFRIIPCADIAITSKAAKLYATLTPLEGMQVMAESHCQTMLEWLEADSRSDRKRLGAILFFTGIFAKTDSRKPAERHATRAVHSIWDSTLLDPKLEMREAGKLALDACIMALPDSEILGHRQILLDDVLMTLSSHTAPLYAIHGALLAACVLAKTATPGSPSAIAVLHSLWPAVLRNRDRDSQISRAVMEFVTIAAECDSATFTMQWLKPTMTMLCEAMKRERDQIPAISAIARVLPVAKYQAEAWLDSIVGILHSSLTQVKRSSSLSQALLELIAGCAIAFGPAIENALALCLDIIFQEGLSPALVKACRDIIVNVPALAYVVRLRLLDLLANAISGVSFQDFAMPMSSNRRASTAGLREPRPPSIDRRRSASLLVRARARSVSPMRMPGHAVKGDEIAHEEVNLDQQLQALRYLGSFDFGVQPLLLGYFQQQVCPLLASSELSMRQGAMEACAGFLLNSGALAQGEHLSSAIREIVQSLVLLGVADSDAGLREHTLASLSQPFDRYLAEADSVRMLLCALNDEILAVRLQVIKLLGRSGPGTQALVLPPLRNELTGLLSVLDQTKVSHTRQLIITVLVHIVEAAPSLAQLYAVPIIKVLEDQLRTATEEGLLLEALTLTSRMAQHAGKALREKAMIFAHFTCSALRDKTSPVKRRRAVATLYDLVAGTACMTEVAQLRDDFIDLIIAHLATETEREARRHAIRALGMLGASRPSLYGEDTNDRFVKELTDTAEAASSADSLESGLISTDLDTMRLKIPLYIADWVLGQLMGIWHEPTLKIHHLAVADAIVRIYRHERSRLRSWHFIERVIPRFIEAVNDKSLDSVSTCFYISALGKIARIAEARVEHETAAILGALFSRWEEGLEPSNCIVEAISDLSAALRGGFQRYLPLVLPKLSFVLLTPTSSEATVLASLRLVQETSPLLRDWIHLLVPALLVAIERPAQAIQSMGMRTLLALACSSYLASHLSRVLPVLHRIYLQPGEMSDQAMQCMCALAKECGTEALAFVHGFERLSGLNILENRYYSRYVEGSAGDIDLSPPEADDMSEVPELNVALIVAAFRPPQDAADWTSWLANISAVFKSSNNHHIRASAPIAEAFGPLQRKLLNYATYTDWLDLPEVARNDICDSMRNILALNAAPEVHDMLLHLIDFMSRMGLELPISSKLCKETALRRKFLHRACRYAELEYLEATDEDVVSDLLRIHHDFQTREPDHALGLLQLTSKTHYEWAELGQYNSFLHTYERKIKEDPTSCDAARGLIRSLHALQEWDTLLDVTESNEYANDASVKQSIAPLVASAAWSAQRFDAMANAIGSLQGPERQWYSAVLATVDNNITLAQRGIDSARDMLCSELVTIGGSRTDRAYDLLVRTQLLTELEEAGRFRNHESERPLIKERWSQRLSNVQKEIEVMQRCLKIHSLAIPAAENARAMTKYARLCRKAGRNDLAHKVLASAMIVRGTDPNDLHLVPENEFSGFTLERCCVAFGFNHAERSNEAMRHLVVKLNDRLDALTKLDKKSARVADKIDEETRVLARCLRTLGDQLRSEDLPSLLEAQTAYEKATSLDPLATKGLRKLANVNLKIIDVLQRKGHVSSTGTIVNLAISVIDCYTHIIQRSSHFPLQDILGILTVIFKYGKHRGAVEAASRAFESLSIDCWLEAIPQLTAQLDYPSSSLQPVLQKHIQKLARAHPHTMLSSLAAVAQYPNKERAAVANQLLDVMRLYDDTLVEEALMVNRELRKCSMTSEEICINGVERAAKYLFGEEPRNPPGMIQALEDMCLAFENPATASEFDFAARYGDQLRAARDLGQRYLLSNNEKELGLVWKKWHAIHKSCAAAVKEAPLIFDLANACPQLAKHRHFKYSVPGTSQRHFGDDINIMRFSSTVDILSSKQRPRKITIIGDDGKEYRFLLKGREDLRLDERCVQLFTLLNYLLASASDAAKRHLRVVKYEVIPLSHDAGLLSWFERGDTLQAILRQHRKMSGLGMDAELKCQNHFAPQVNRGTLTSMQLLEVFEVASECSKGDEISSILWRKSTSTSAWLERRTKYSRSLAVTSMVGHLLGLGDRHPSNVLMDRFTGEIVQIDYGDAFEAAQERDSFPERVPFRCTRQLINALPVTKVEGLFRLTSQLVMRILRDNCESIEAVFSSFVHDPLIQHLVLNPRQLVDVDQQGRPQPDDAVTQVGTPQTRFNTRRRKTTSKVEHNASGLSPRAQRVVDRVRQKLDGMEFGNAKPISVEEQVSRLILQATDPHNLSRSYGGWCPWW